MRELLAAAERVQWETKIDKILSLLGGALAPYRAGAPNTPDTLFEPSKLKFYSMPPISS